MGVISKLALRACVTVLIWLIMPGLVTKSTVTNDPYTKIYNPVGTGAFLRIAMGCVCVSVLLWVQYASFQSVSKTPTAENNHEHTQRTASAGVSCMCLNVWTVLSEYEDEAFQWWEILNKSWHWNTYVSCVLDSWSFLTHARPYICIKDKTRCFSLCHDFI